MTTCVDGRCMVKLNKAERRSVQGSMFIRGKAWQWDKEVNSLRILLSGYMSLAPADTQPHRFLYSE